MRIGYIGLGKMGSNMVLRLLEQGIEVVVWNRSKAPIEELKFKIKSSKLKIATQNLKVAKHIEDFISELQPPRIIWIMVSAGRPVDEVLKQLVTLVWRGDLIIDGGNSFYEDTLRRGEMMKEKGIRYMDVGVSGGPAGARSGACLMIGSDKKDFEEVEDLIKAIAAPSAYGYFGPLGAGHFVKMVHNGIEYGMMEAIAEGAAVLKFGPYKVDLAEVFRVYNNRSVIESRLVGWAKEAFLEDQELSGTSSTVGLTGEGEWTVEIARELGVEVPVIEKSLEIRKNSEKDKEDSPKGFRNKVVSGLRGKFGGHEVKKGETPSK